MDNKNLCLVLTNCETENEVKNILNNNSLWNAPSCWSYFGDIEDNYATIGNQQEQPEYALVEKIINSVDALVEVAPILRTG